MVNNVIIQTMVNGKPITPTKMRDPFELSSFPGVVDNMKGKSLEKLGRDISVVTRRLARTDETLSGIKVSYKVEGGDLIITSEQSHDFGYDYLRRQELMGDEGALLAPNPKLHIMKATLAVLNGKRTGEFNTTNDIAFDIVKKWRESRSMGSFGISPKVAIPTFFGGAAAIGLSMLM